jgi:hypothetical protein
MSDSFFDCRCLETHCCSKLDLEIGKLEQILDVASLDCGRLHVLVDESKSINDGFKSVLRSLKVRSTEKKSHDKMMQVDMRSVF